MKKLYEYVKHRKIIVFCRYFLMYITIKYRHIIRSADLKYKKILSFLEKNNSENCCFEDLTPKDVLKDNKTYIESLDWALSNDNILNIALTGPYGSGKSSILKTYKENRSHYNYLNLSLATFHTYTNSQDEDEIKTTSEKKDAKENQTEYQIETICDKISAIETLSENEIEKRILQQLFYKVKSKKIPFGRFRKINNIRSSV